MRFDLLKTQSVINRSKGVGSFPTEQAVSFTSFPACLHNLFTAFHGLSGAWRGGEFGYACLFMTETEGQSYSLASAGRRKCGDLP